MSFSFRPLTEDDARAMLAWHYQAPYDIYDPERGSLETLLNDEHRYHAVTRQDGDIVGFCCFGVDTQVPGGDYETDALDVGLGLRPDLIGRGDGVAFVTAIVEYAEASYKPQALRLTVATFNRRAIRVYQEVGFGREGVFLAPSGSSEEFILMTKPVSRA